MPRTKATQPGERFNCPVEIPITVLGGKWRLVLVFHLPPGPQRNGELRRLVPGITQKMLIQQLRELEQHGVVIRTVHREVPPNVDYRIDPGEARQLRALISAMCQWANYWAARTGAEIDDPVAGPA